MFPLLYCPTSFYELIEDFLSLCLDKQISQEGTSFLHELLVRVFFSFLCELPESHMSHRDISSLHELIADEFSDFLSAWLDSHKSHKDI